MKSEPRSNSCIDDNQAVPICALVVTYKPSAVQMENLLALPSQFDFLIVVDNTPTDENESEDLFQQLAAHKNVRLICNRTNLGIAAALNTGVNMARQLGYQWVVTLDQDSRPGRQLMDFFRSFLRGRLLLPKTGVVGANYRNSNNGRLGFSPQNTEQEVAPVKCVITSGSLLNLQCYEEIGGFEEKLFIDMVDTEYCFRARQHGYSVLISALPLMEHAVGNAQAVKILGRDFIVTQHPPLRRYYIFRNTLYMARKYIGFDFFGCMELLWVYLPKVLIKSLLGQQKRENLRMIAKGIYDGVFNYSEIAGKG